LTVQLALYSGLVMNTELAAARRADKSRRMAAKIPVAAERNNARATAAKAFKTAANCMSEAVPMMVDIAQADAGACGAKAEQKISPSRRRAKTLALPGKELSQTGSKGLSGKSPVRHAVGSSQ
jgi:hypothetical protein